MSTFEDEKRAVRKELREWAEENPDADYNDAVDRIFEIADGSVPVYNGEIIEWAAQDYSLALSEPEIGPAFDGTPTPVNIIAANIYEALTQECHEEWREIEQEREDAALDAEDEDDDALAKQEG